MSHSFKLSRRIARLRAPVYTLLLAALFGCDNTNSFNPDSSTLPDASEDAALDPLSAIDEAEPLGDEIGFVPAELPEGPAVSFAGGIPIGVSSQPTSAFGDRYNGALRNIWPAYLKKELAAIKARGGKVLLTFSGNHKYYLDGRYFSLSKWKSRVANFKGVDFSSYINDGTIIGHYLIDEPNDAANWGGRPVSASVVEEMAKYSKDLWPNLPTVVRAQPDYFNNNHRYLDAAWAQYLHRRGNVRDYIRKQIAAAQDKGLALVVGLNVIHGGSPNGTKMTASEIRDWGSALLESSYPCAFISWQHNSYLSSGDIEKAMSDLRRKAENRSHRSCRGN